MKKQFLQITTVLLMALIACTSVHAQTFPQPEGFVSDFAKLLSQEVRDSLNAELVRFRDETTVEIAVVTVPNLGGSNIDTFAVRLGDEWKVGNKDSLNGIVFLIALAERKMCIRTAPGVKNVVTDDKNEYIRLTVIRPFLKANDWTNGVVRGTHAIMDVIHAARTAQSAPVHTPHPWTTQDTLILLIIIGAVILLIVIIVAIRRVRACNEVLKRKDGVVERLDKLALKMSDPEMSDNTRRSIRKLQDRLKPIRDLLRDSSGVKWVSTRDELNSIEWYVSNTESAYESDQAYAKKAREEGPVLMEKLPEKLRRLEKKLKGGKQSEEASQLLAHAQQEYARARSIRAQACSGGGMGILDWIIVFAILDAIVDDSSRAVEHHDYANTTHHPSYGGHQQSDQTASDTVDSFGGGGQFSGGGGGSNDF
ncbi:MAG: hypothetical protein A2898_02090 [Candidatus Kerfeldbacteria bacterium RIFCSPLOWO2_01_FULL_48_11]|uniref:TPM domain-containing protein n=1 Tax=Candidatus Kerfeldbacteria bacterium RIFCSPLOWO2_01_FULL_48_11 TaxID=1798543 RepID=A0A1G2B4W9_9BACT|nr:MAG: hypothetical protein UY34_C0019G0004 [Parcubacteria group bacterium GW2011_GWA2_48_9]KKW16088.1 MAG: hypothetical protein UY52_C0011G0076 [Parcubacteria group bacterium GW2011_GWC2_49_9]OGY84035.1 MAG: hypothetical protein A2898_02090 [Candidatus Kerfeldbacteria bacterium RIFCSPLOWO2_01_FULL_48_11]